MHIITARRISLYILYTAIAGMCLFAPVFLLHAQVGQVLSINADPALPGAYTNVQVRISSFSIDLNRSTIFWYVNDRLEGEGAGLTSFQFKTGAIGEHSKIDAVVRTPAGGRVSQTLSFRPAEVDLLWQAHTFTPPFYKGKSLPSSEAFIKINAFAHFADSRGRKIGPSDLIYRWEQDGVSLGSISGVGKDTAVVRALPVSGGTSYITVAVSSLSGILQARNTAVIRTRDPFIAFYEKHPLEGILYNTILGNTFSLEDGEITVRAEPYFFSIDDIAKNALDYIWSINREKIDAGQNQKDLTLRRETNGGGSANVSLRVKNKNISRILQDITSGFRINF